MEGEETIVSSKAEEYLEAIYRLERKRGYAKTVELARNLKVVPGSVTNTIEHLEKLGLVIHEPYKGIRLTEKGRRLASDVVRRHRLAERLLTDILHIEWSEVHETACKLEHAIPEEIIKPLESKLGHPKTCPHGNPIPKKNGGIPEEKSEPLTELKQGEGGVVVKITEEKRDMLQYLASLGLTIGTTVEIEEKAPFNGPIIVKARGASYALGNDVASVIWVKKS